MAIAPLIVSIRTAGAAALGRLSASFRRLGAEIRVAYARFRLAGGIPGWLRRLPAAIGRATRALRVFAIAARAAARAVNALGRAVSALNARFVFIAALVGLAVLAVAPLVGVIGNLLPLTMLLAPALLAVASGFAVWKMAMSGFGDAVKADNAEDLAEALKKLSPNARAAALAVRELGREWKFTQQFVQNRFFAGAADDFKAISRAIQAVAQAWLPRFADAFANARHALRGVIDEAQKSGQLDRIFRSVAGFFSGLLSTVAPLTQAFLDIAEVAAPSLEDLGGGIAAAAQRFADWIRQLKDDGTLKRWLDRAKETFGQLKDIGHEVGRIFAAIFKGSDSKGFLDSLKNSLSSLADFLEGEDGQAMIRFFGEVAAAAVGLIRTVEKVVKFFQDGWNAFRSDTEGLRNSLTTAFAAIGAGMTGMLTVISGGASAFGWISGVVSRIGGLVSTIQGAAGLINAALNSIRTSVFIDIITRRFDGGSQGYAKPMGGGSGGGGGLKYFASGGSFRSGQVAVVGEEGPELVRFGQSGRVFPNGSTLSGGTTQLVVAPGADSAVSAFLKELVRTGQLSLRVDRSGKRVIPG